MMTYSRKGFLFTGIVFAILALWTQGVYCQTFAESLQRTSQIKDLLKIKNPFKSPIKRQTKSEAKNKQQGFLKDGIYTNLVDFSTVDINKIQIVGVLVGKERRAVARAEGIKGTFTLKEGMKLGINQVELKAILPGGVVFVEKLSNLYGEEEYLETVVSISQ